MALNEGQKINTVGSHTVKVLLAKPDRLELGEGGQGIVYKVEYDGKPMALKWFKKGAWKKPSDVYNNLKKNIDRKSPMDSSSEELFLWPKDITEWVDGTFGYVMELRPKEYIEFTEVLVSEGDSGFPSFKAVVEVCIKIVSAFRLLHNAGYSYQDMNSGNFFIKPKTGQVLICDNDNVAPNGTNMGVIGTPQYMAPEIVANGETPSTHTDEFSLAVVLFLLLCRNHPLEGKRWVVPCLTPNIEEMLYGKDALFIFDQFNDANKPVPGVHDNALSIWAYLPDYVKDAFVSAFSQEAIKNPNKRLRELDWLKVLVRFQSDIVKCPHCKNEIFILNGSSTNCDECRRLYTVKNTLELRDYSVPIAKNTRVYKCQLGVCNAKDALNLIARVVSKDNDPSVLGLMNMTENTLKGTTPSGKTNQIKPNDVIPIISGISIEVSDSKINII